MTETVEEAAAPDKDEVKRLRDDGPRVAAAPPAGHFFARFVDVGAGDCIIMRTPGGKTILLDAGTRCAHLYSDDEHGIQTIIDYPCGADVVDGRLTEDLANIAGAGANIDFLFVTHRHTDHHNKLRSKLLGDRKIGRMFYSGKVDSQTSAACDIAADGYMCRLTWTWTWEEDEDGDENEKENRHIYIRNADNRFAETECAQNRWAGHGLTALDHGGLQILQEDDHNFSVVVLISEDGYDGRDRTFNRSSVVLLIQHGDRKMLLCGDATGATEQTLIRHYRDGDDSILKDVQILKVGHHGSHESSSQDFVDLVNPQDRVVITADVYGDPSYKHPREQTVDLYLAKLAGRPARPAAKRHWVWQNGGQDPFLRAESDRPLWITGSDGPIDVDWA